MSAIERFEDIKSWQEAREFVRKIYLLTKREAFSKDFELINQTRRASTSIMHNIAEGFDGGSNAEFSRFLTYAQRSCTEVKSQLYVAVDQSYITETEFNEFYENISEIHLLIGDFIKYLKTNKSK